MYTQRQKTVCDKTVGMAINTARAIIGNKPMCTNAVSYRRGDEKITTEEMDKLITQIVDDSHFYG